MFNENFSCVSSDCLNPVRRVNECKMQLVEKMERKSATGRKRRKHVLRRSINRYRTLDMIPTKIPSCTFSNPENKCRYITKPPSV